MSGIELLLGVGIVFAAIVGFFVGRYTGVFTYRRGFSDGRIYEQALQVKAIATANDRLDNELSSEELTLLANIRNR